MSTYSGCGCASEDCRVNGCLAKRQAQSATAPGGGGYRDDVRALRAERDALREALKVMVEMIEMKGFGFHYAMDLARAALAQEERHETV